MAHYPKQVPRKNIFNVFNMGKSYFLIRTVVEIVAFMAVIFAGIKLWSQAQHPYPSIVRDPSGRVFSPKADMYQPTMLEAIQLTRDLVEVLFTRAETGTTLNALSPFMSAAVTKPFQAGFVNTNARVSGLCIFQAKTNNVPDAVHPTSFGALIEISLYTWQDGKTTTDSMYVVLMMQQEESNRSAENPAGWRVTRFEDHSRAYFIENLQIVWRTKDLEYLKEWNRALIPDVLGTVNLKQLLDTSQPLTEEKK